MKYWVNEFLASEFYGGFYVYGDYIPINSTLSYRKTNTHNLTGASTLIWKYYQSVKDFVYKDKCDWGIRVTDDTFLNLPQLKLYLYMLNSQHDPKQRFY
jgi:hypothetical protein